MSMISAQIDELRELAGDDSMEWVAGPVRASVLRDAADTIWELRDDLQRANAGNAKLRKKADMLQWNSDCFIKIYGSWKRLRATVPHLERENAKLWKLANGYETITATLCNERGCDGCQFNDTEQIVCEHMRLQTCLAELEIGKEKKDGMEA